MSDNLNSISSNSFQWMDNFNQIVCRKKRTLVEYIDCSGHENPNMSPTPMNRVDPEAGNWSGVVNGNSPIAEIPPEPMNEDDPDEEIQPVVEEEMPAEMREHITERMGGYRVQMIIEKKLTATDMRTNQGRLSLPKKMVRVEFMTAEEEKMLEHRSKGDDELNYIDTFIVGSDLRVNPIRFKKWLMGKNYVNCLVNKWNSFARAYGLKTGTKVRVWSFRVDERDENDVVKSELRFALVKI
ncbi:B3 domain-containing protein At2g31720-like [Cucurbita maxima]|uniref:B3 domain-containing protein At2g31720-like n=1 Tax=Cucurbita maxima TaxID=3661 RepID=A0A6J1K9G9_CUCMA|nr:B3 domain-containing protein At2g31720-like [Cucurbita maxima]